jgi:hypothetical protein
VQVTDEDNLFRLLRTIILLATADPVILALMGDYMRDCERNNLHTGFISRQTRGDK